MARTKDRHTINEAFGYSFDVDSAGSSKGVIKSLSFTYGSQIPWYDVELPTINEKYLDVDYHGNHSGNKYCSPMIEELLKAANEDELKVNFKNAALAAVYNRFIKSWTDKWNALYAEYAPLENYSMVEEMTDDITEHEKGATNTRTYDTQHGKTGTDTTTPATEITAEGSVYGYDSSTPTPDNKTVTSTSGTNETEYDTEETDTGTITDVGSGTDTDTRNYTLTRRGNIGVTTSQQMLMAELEVRAYDFFQSVFNDIDKVLTVPIY